MRILTLLLIPILLIAQKIELGGKFLEVEVAKTKEEWTKGLQSRKSLKENNGMLFVYEKPQILSFWMKNTPIPLSVAFFDENQILTQITDMPVARGERCPTYESRGLAKYALEVNFGWFQKNHIQPGTKFSFLNSGNGVE